MHTNSIPINPALALEAKYSVGFTRPIAFGITSCTCIFSTAAYFHDKDEESIWKLVKERTATDLHRLRDIITDESLLKHDILKEKLQLWIQRKNEFMQRLQHRLDHYRGMPTHIKKSILSSAELYLGLTEKQKVLASLTAIQLFIFAVWHVPRYQRFMQRYFVHTGERTITLFTSMFSHRRLWHLTMNMAGLWTVGTLFYDTLGREQFIATYLSLGISANVVSHVIRLALARIKGNFSWAPATMPMLGSDSTFYGMLTGSFIIYPQAVLISSSVLPTPVLLSYTIPAFLCADALAIFLRFNKLLDPVAHIAAAALGVIYAKVGPDILWPQTVKVVRDIKSRINSSGSGNSGGESSSGALMLIPEKLRRKLQKKAATPVPEAES